VSGRCGRDFFKCGKLIYKFLKVFAYTKYKRENPFEGRLLVYKVTKRVIVFPSE
jgi:hypothetical protein